MVSKKVYFTTLAVIVIILGGLNVFGAAPFHYLKDIVKNDGTQVDANNDGVIDASALAQNSNLLGGLSSADILAQIPQGSANVNVSGCDTDTDGYNNSFSVCWLTEMGSITTQVKSYKGVGGAFATSIGLGRGPSYGYEGGLYNVNRGIYLAGVTNCELIKGTSTLSTLSGSCSTPGGTFGGTVLRPYVLFYCTQKIASGQSRAVECQLNGTTFYYTQPGVSYGGCDTVSLRCNQI